MSDQLTIPDDMAQRVARLINEAEDMRAQAVDDLKTIYGDLREELKALGWVGQNVSKEVAALKGAIAEMRLDEEKKAKREEKGDRVDDYVSILSKARARAPARTRENIEQSGAGIDPKLAHTIVTGLQTETGRKALIAAVDIMIEREEAEEKATVATQGEATVSLSPENVNPRDSGGSGANEGGDDVDGGAERADHCDQEELEPSGPDVNGHPNSPEEATQFHAKASDDACEAGRKTLGRAEASAEAPDGAELVSRGVGDRAPTATSEAMDVTGGESAATESAVDGVRYEATPPMPMKSLPYAACFPELTKVEYDALTSVIKLQGVMEPIVRMGDVIVNGWNRYNIARSLGIEYPVVSYHGNDVLLDVIRWQREDRAWTSAQEQKIAARLAKEVSHRASDIMRAFQIEEEFA